MEGRKVKRKRMKEDHNDVAEKRDRLAQLPEPLLHHILSYLTMNDVIRTSVLAKRWQYTWLYVPCLTFSAVKMSKSRSKEVAFITDSLHLHKGSKVEKLNITIRYTRAEFRLLDTWVRFAWSHNVNRLYLDFSKWEGRTAEYKLNDIIFLCSSLIVLAVKGCIIEFPVKIKLGSLKTLSFDEVTFDGGALEIFLSSCSILEELSLASCRWVNNLDLDLVIMNSCVKTLKIGGNPYYNNSKFQINAPFIISFEVGSRFASYLIKGMESLRSASLVCTKPNVCRKLHSFHNLKDLERLCHVCHVKDLRMCSCYIQAISRTQIPTQDCREKHAIDFISFDVTCLRIKAELMKSELPGIAYILSHSPNLETLIISIDKIKGKEHTLNFEEKEYWKLQEPNFVNLLCNLKEVKIYNFMKNISLLDSKAPSTTDDFLAHLQNDMNFLRFLLKNSKVMERMAVTTVKRVNFGCNSKSKKSKLLSQITQELVAFPRASQAAQISLN